MTHETLLSRLSGVKRNGAGWQALCPAHADKNPSLSIDVRADKILVHCHAGCSQEAVCAALKIEVRELFLDASDGKAQAVDEYPYTDEHGTLLYQVVRLEPKSFVNAARTGTVVGFGTSTERGACSIVCPKC